MNSEEIGIVPSAGKNDGFWLLWGYKINLGDLAGLECS